MDVVELLLLLVLDVFVLLQAASVLHIRPVSRQHHEVVDLEGSARSVRFNTVH